MANIGLYAYRFPPLSTFAIFPLFWVPGDYYVAPLFFPSTSQVRQSALGGRNPPSRIKSTRSLPVQSWTGQLPVSRRQGLSSSLSLLPCPPWETDRPEGEAKCRKRVRQSNGTYILALFDRASRVTEEKPGTSRRVGRGSPFGLWWAENDDADTPGRRKKAHGVRGWATRQPFSPFSAGVRTGRATGRPRPAVRQSRHPRPITKHRRRNWPRRKTW